MSALQEALGVKPPALSIEHINALIYGEPGVGKTYLLGTAQDSKDTSPLLILDIDGGIQTLRHRKDIHVIQLRSYEQLIGVYQQLFNSIKNGKMPYGTIGIDTLSELQKLDIGKIAIDFANDNAKLDGDVPDMRAYYKSGEHMRKVVRAFRDLPCHVIFNCHTGTDKDNFNRTTYFPALPGKLRSDIPGFLDIVGWLRAEAVDGEVKRYLQVQKTEATIAKDRTNSLLPIEEDPTIPKLWDKLKLSNPKGA